MKYLLLAFSLAIAPATHADIKIFSCEPEWATLAQEIGQAHVDALRELQHQSSPP